MARYLLYIIVYTDDRHWYILQDCYILGNIWAAMQETDIFPQGGNFEPWRMLDDEGKIIRNEKLMIFSVGEWSNSQPWHLMILTLFINLILATVHLTVILQSCLRVPVTAKWPKCEISLRKKKLFIFWYSCFNRMGQHQAGDINRPYHGFLD